MNEQQRIALNHLAGLTELGRTGRDPSPQCSYGVKGTENGIQLFQMGVKDGDMKCFSLLPDWQYITLRENDISDNGFRYLSNQRDLRFLDISETHITTLNPIKDAHQLRSLWCDMLENLTDRKAIALGNFRELKFLDLGWTGISDATANRLVGMSELQKLNVVGTKISDRGLRDIGTLPKLEMLGLYRTTITDDGLRHLHGMKHLRLLVIGETPVTAKGKREIKRAIPGLKVAEHEGIY